MEQALEQARVTATTTLGAEVEDLKISTYTDPEVPGLVVFHAEKDDGLDHVEHMGGAVVAGRTYVNGAEALGKVFDAWGYGATRTKTADEVARVAVMLIPADEPSRVMTTEADFAYAARKGFTDAAVPADVDVDGRNGVQFWFKNGYNPITEVFVAPAAAPGDPALIRYGRSHGGG